MLKKLTFCLMAVLGGASAFAGHMNEAMPAASGVNLIAPHQDGYWTFGAQANYFQPNNDFNYAYGSFTTTTNGSPTINDIQSKTFAVGSDNDWGWGVDVTYHFPGEGRDVTLAFTQLNTSDSNSVEVGDGEFATINPMLSGRSSGKGNPFGLETAFGEAEGKVDTNYDAVDLTFGQLITVGRRVDLHPFAGLRYAYIDYKATGEYSNFPLIDPTINNELVGEQTLKSNFQGVGPRLGSDAMVNLGSGFSLKGTLGVSLLAGNIDAEDSSVLTTLTTSRGSALEIISETIADHDVDTSMRVVPEADAKLAAMYHTEFNQGYGVGFEVGYQVTNYFNAIVNNTVDDTVSTSTQYTDFFMQGPYARIQLDVA